MQQMDNRRSNFDFAIHSDVEGKGKKGKRMKSRTSLVFLRRFAEKRKNVGPTPN